MQWTAKGLEHRGAEHRGAEHRGAEHRGAEQRGAGAQKAGGGPREGEGTEAAEGAGAGAQKAGGGPREGGGAEAAEGAAEEVEEEVAEEVEGAEEAEEAEATGVDVAKEEAPLHAEEVRCVLASSSAVVGMHPDGATEAIVDFGLATGKIFACVPCCVYSNFFPSRRDAHGRKVTRYDAFIDYLVAKAPGRIGVATLPFEGKNRVVYSLRSDQACAPCDEESIAEG